MQSLHDIDAILSASVAANRCSEQEYKQVLDKLRVWYSGRYHTEEGETIYAEFTYEIALPDMRLDQDDVNIIQYFTIKERVSLQDLVRKDGVIWTEDALMAYADSANPDILLLKYEDVDLFLKGCKDPQVVRHPYHAPNGINAPTFLRKVEFTKVEERFFVVGI
jgi:hypothetical protein